ncbi:Ltp family lipoprotein [Lysinibacillus sp. M3]|uniref:Ltp family lipoprotein n=1 Tax=Lysinibacillus zambalensis TaxID=3160866 RepID=A0ABV1MMH2_9BACI
MSKAGIYDQLTSEYGEKFPADAAQFAIDNIVFDRKGNALKKAQLTEKNLLQKKLNRRLIT